MYCDHNMKASIFITEEKETARPQGAEGFPLWSGGNQSLRFLMYASIGVPCG